VSLVDAAMPGMLPVPEPRVRPPGGSHRHGAEAKINAWSRFDRKNYFYADCRRAIRSASSTTRSWAKGRSRS
jgi:Asp-tRNA(Asn)/Glu-tRNA(Gln) amidotransferase B subunit